MQIQDLAERFAGSREEQCRAIFSTLFIAGNRLQTLFDSRIPQVSLKQFMLLALVRQSEEPMSCTRLGELLGCSRQNVRKLAEALEKKGFVCLEKGEADPRTRCVRCTEKAQTFFREDFSASIDELRYLFEVFSSDEIETLFRLLTRLYDGIENLEQKTRPRAEKGEGT